MIPAAVLALLVMTALLPGGTAVAATALELGQAALVAGNLDDARANLERAAALDPADARPQLLLALLHFSRGDLADARERAERALALAPDSSRAHEVLGDVHYREGYLDRARREWEAALPGAGPREHVLRMNLERAAREAEAETSFGRDVSRHFTIQYDGPVPGAVARTALRLLEEAYDRLWHEFGRAPQHDIPVILYGRGLFDEITRSAAWVTGTYDGKIRVPVGGLNDAEDAERLGPVLAHELTHAFVRANVPGRLPLWFEEGLAQHFEGATTEGARHVLRGQGVAFATLDQTAAALRGGPHVGAAYAASYLAVAELIRMDGFWLPRRILELMALGRPFEEAFRDAAGIDLARFEEQLFRTP